ncbi:glycosyltransferase family 4 protein [Candidatus Peregrinibacteria bacterium]|nr:glycosyltransferase family 4 protein [Candidatus Peregrinibacteria bacterium]MBI3816662.1 glycosyltransferase family 4 protein [Candidatus Peregrinibacteria bacterium]
MKRVGIDCRFAASRAGLGRYTRELVTRLLAREDGLRYTLFVADPHEPWLEAIQKRDFDIIPANFRPYSWAEQGRFPLILGHANIDLLFAPHFNVPLLCRVPFVVTVHDLILHRFPNRASFLRQHAYRFVMAHSIRRARHVIAVSNFTQREILSIYGNRLRSKVSVIHEGVGGEFRRIPADRCREVLAKYAIDRPFFLYVGNAKQHKNVQALIDAFAIDHPANADLLLVTTGREADGLILRDDVRLLRDIDDDDLPALYSSAIAFVTASLYEGFGLPIIEAEACGCPVIALRKGAIPEVASPSAALLSSLDDLPGALRNPPASPAMSRRWDWEETAERTVGVLRRMIDSVPRNMIVSRFPINEQTS